MELGELSEPPPCLRACKFKTLSLALALILACLNPKIPNPNFINPISLDLSIAHEQPWVQSAVQLEV